MALSWVSGLLVALLVLVPASARAWNSSGHRLIALLAYDRLPRAQRQRLAQLLRQHPRFAQDFSLQLPKGLAKTQQGAWVFAHAATWPDLARHLKVRSPSGQRYDHPSWHYVNIPLSLEEAPAQGCGRPRSARACQLASASRDRGGQLHIDQALRQQLAALRDASRSEAERALALSWVLHLVADAHQPLHAVALFDPVLLPKGDRGGNEIWVGRGRRAKTLHATWDALLGRQGQLARLRSLAAELEAQHRGQMAQAVSGKAWNSPRRWLEESCRLAQRRAYSDQVRSALKAQRGPSKPTRLTLDLDRDDRLGARAAARVRAAEAAARLAALLREI